MRYLAKSLLFLAFLLCAPYAYAHDEKITPQEDKTFKRSLRDIQVTTKEQLPDISKMSDKELNNLPKDVMDKLPIKELFKRFKDGGNGPLMENAVLLFLSRLAYFETMPEEVTRKAIKKFQRDIEQPQTGELTFGQLTELQRRATRIGDNPIYLGTFGDKLNVFSFKDDFVSTEGTWIIEGEKIFAPINHSKIVCYKQRSSCEVDQVDIVIPSLEKSDEAYRFILSKERYDVISWSANEVIAQGGTECRTTIMTINILNNEVFQITRNKTDKGCDLGVVKFPPLKKPRIARLKPGWNLSFDFWKNRKKETLQYLNSEVYKRLKVQIKILETTREKKK